MLLGHLICPCMSRLSVPFFLGIAEWYKNVKKDDEKFSKLMKNYHTERAKSSTKGSKYAKFCLMVYKERI